MKRQQGLTLIEVLIAIMIIALIGLASALVLSQMTASERNSAEHHKQLAELQFALLMLDRDVRQMVVRPVRQVPEERRRIYVTNSGDLTDSDSGGLAFVRAGWTNPQGILPRAELQPVVYRARDNVLQRLYTPFVDDATQDPAIQDLLTGVTEFTVTFYHNGEELERWERPDDLPQRVHIQIEHEYFGVIDRVLLTSGEKPGPVP
ncbi:MAG: type II secretion system minor pseudopilin GspJ [Idiomarina sp.]|nr:type II secretion system minor pseudopilin GspJ [Idiomarina sp.]